MRRCRGTLSPPNPTRGLVHRPIRAAPFPPQPLISQSSSGFSMYTRATLRPTRSERTHTHCHPSTRNDTQNTPISIRTNPPCITEIKARPTTLREGRFPPAAKESSAPLQGCRGVQGSGGHRARSFAVPRLCSAQQAWLLVTARTLRASSSLGSPKCSPRLPASKRWAACTARRRLVGGLQWAAAKRRTSSKSCWRSLG